MEFRTLNADEISVRLQSIVYTDKKLKQDVKVAFTYYTKMLDVIWQFLMKL